MNPYVRSIAFTILLIFGFSTPASAVWSSREAYEKYLEGLRELYKNGVKPPDDSPLIGSWGVKGEDWVYVFTKDGRMTFTKPSGEIRNGTWLHQAGTAGDGLIGVFKTGDYITTMRIQEGKLIIDRGDTWNTLPPTNTPMKKPAEQGGTGQPASRPESKSEGGDKPQLEAEGRTR